jgi:hypothetical protein
MANAGNEDDSEREQRDWQSPAEPGPARSGDVHSTTVDELNGHARREIT